MRIAVLADIHGNLPALRSVLSELDRDPVDTIVVLGDVCGGALVRESLMLLSSRAEPVAWVRGNCEREACEAFDGGETADDASGRAAAWSARALDRGWCERLGSWPIASVLDGVCFCHGSPRRDDEILTRATPPAAMRDALDGVDERLVVGGHTHQQMVRRLADDLVFANPGSVGMPYEGRPAAFWMIVADGEPKLRETRYDLTAALPELEASGFPDLPGQLGDSLVEPADPDWVTRFFEHLAGRGRHPDDS